eukprot:UN11371
MKVLREVSSAPRDLKLFVGLLDCFNRELLGFISRCVLSISYETQKISSAVLKESND